MVTPLAHAPPLPFVVPVFRMSLAGGLCSIPQSVTLLYCRLLCAPMPLTSPPPTGRCTTGTPSSVHALLTLSFQKPVPSERAPFGSETTAVPFKAPTYVNARHTYETRSFG
ncbi:unnamed protein product [Ectocarpus sp. 12 AP-2014]